MSVLKPESLEKSSKNAEKQPAENRKNTKYRNTSQFGVRFLH